ncbi:MAG: BON domain-containing protein [Chitinivibrionales bacterium]|nr:BON domain-containing protein [Chitinivibrionales bacterium]
MNMNTRNSIRKELYMRHTILNTLILCFISIAVFSGDPAIAREKEILDHEIVTAVRNKLLVDEAVSAHMIEISSEENIVVLSGTVAHLRARNRAATLAKTIKGVRGVVNDIEVMPVERSDSRIRRDILQALALDPATESYEITVIVNDGAVLLEGEVESWAEKRLCRQVAESVKGVKEITNSIIVDFKTDRSDSEIQSDIRRKLELDPYVSEDLLDISVNDGIVALSGEVGSAIEKTYAYNDSWVAGVDSVDKSDVEVKWWVHDEMERQSKYTVKPDEELKKAVKDVLLWDPRTLSFDIDVTVSNAVVALNGTVDNLEAKRSAGQDARNTPGVLKVNNFIRVAPPEIHDEEIERNVTSALLWDPVVERHQIKVDVRNKKVYLYGAVDSYYEKMHAQNIASRIQGVAAVDNYLAVHEIPDRRSDLEIKEDIREQLQWNWYVDEENISVSVNDGIVTLKGTVDNKFEENAAVREAFDGGATAVDNKIKVGGRTDEPDEKQYRDDADDFSLYYYFMN